MHVLVTCKYKKDWIKNKREKVETSFSPLYANGGFLLPGKPVLIQSAQKSYAAFPHPNDATYKIWSRLATWLQRYLNSKVWNFRPSRASNSKMRGLIQPKIELDQAFMIVLVTSNFDDDSIKKERARMETPFSHYKSMGNVLDTQGQLTPKSVVRSGRNSNSSKILCMSLLPANI